MRPAWVQGVAQDPGSDPYGQTVEGLAETQQDHVDSANLAGSEGVGGQYVTGTGAWDHRRG